MRQHLVKLPLASAPLTVKRESKKRSISIRCFTFPATPLTVERERERERARGASPPLIVVSICIPV
jgi:hypothetical protein